MALAIMYAWSTSVYMQNSIQKYILQSRTWSKLIAYPLNMHIKFALHAEEICGASGITSSAHQQPAGTLQAHILECATCRSMPEGVCTLK